MYFYKGKRTPSSLLDPEAQNKGVVVSNFAFLSSEFYGLLYSTLFSHFEKFGGNSPNEDHVPHKPLCTQTRGWGWQHEIKPICRALHKIKIANHVHEKHVNVKYY